MQPPSNKVRRFLENQNRKKLVYRLAVAILYFFIWGVDGIFSLNAQVQVYNKGAKINIGVKTAIGLGGSLLNDSTSVIRNSGIIGYADVVKNQGVFELSDTSSVLTIDSILNLEKGKVILNENTVVIYNQDSNSIKRTEGRLISENSKWGKVKWHIGESTGKYEVPFFTDSLENVSISMDIKTAGEGNGFMVFSTYATSSDNEPLPKESSFYPNTAEAISVNSSSVADRYWLTRAGGYQTPPMSKLILHYADREIGGDNDIETSELIASRITRTCNDNSYIIGTTDFGDNYIIGTTDWELVDIIIGTTDFGDNYIIGTTDWELVDIIIGTTDFGDNYIIGTTDFGDNYFTLDSVKDYATYMLHDNDLEIDECEMQSSCEEAFWIDDPADTAKYVLKDTVMWMKFEASRENFEISFKSIDEVENLPFALQRIFLYEDSCENLSLVAHDSIRNEDLDKLSLKYEGLTIGDIYYLNLTGNLSFFEVYSEYSGGSGKTSGNTFVPKPIAEIDREPAFNQTSINIFPNPAQINITVEYYFGDNSQVEFVLYNLLDKQLLKEKLPTSENSTVLYLHDLPNGIYLYQVVSSSTVLKNGKVIISK